MDYRHDQFRSAPICCLLLSPLPSGSIRLQLAFSLRCCLRPHRPQRYWPSLTPDTRCKTWAKPGSSNPWHPWHGPLKQPYRFRYRDDREYRLHGAAAGLIYRQILDGHILDWLSSYPVLCTSLLYVPAGQYEHASMLGELVIQADRASVAQELGGNPNRVILKVPKQALQCKLLDGLR